MVCLELNSFSFIYLVKWSSAVFFHSNQSRTFPFLSLLLSGPVKGAICVKGYSTELNDEFEFH